MKNLQINLLLLAMLGFAGCATVETDFDFDWGDKPKNVILFIGDGMGVSTVTAARIFEGQQRGNTGEENLLSFEHFPNVALIKTYNTDLQVPDSAGTMSAIMTGEKTSAGVISVNASVKRGDCASGLAGELETLLERSEDQGIATGVISTAKITHATPAATYAHAALRGWESEAPEGCEDIASQLVSFDHGNGIEIMLGGGRQGFYPNDVADVEYSDKTGARKDNRNLVAEWQQKGGNRTYVWNREQLLAADPQTRLLGLFEPSHMQYDADRDAEAEPSLAEMTGIAIERLSKEKNGYLLVIEAGRIDHAHHAANAYRAMMDTVAYAKAVSQAVEMTDEDETLILVTADHSHTFTISGYPARGNPILGKARGPDGELIMDAEGHPYTTLGYANGPGYVEELEDLTEVDTEAPDYQQRGTFPGGSETHGGEDVPAYALGVGAEKVRGVMEQNKLYDVMADVLFGQ